MFEYIDVFIFSTFFIITYIIYSNYIIHKRKKDKIFLNMIASVIILKFFSMVFGRLNFNFSYVTTLILMMIFIDIKTNKFNKSIYFQFILVLLMVNTNKYQPYILSVKLSILLFILYSSYKLFIKKYINIYNIITVSITIIYLFVFLFSKDTIQLLQIQRIIELLISVYISIKCLIINFIILNYKINIKKGTLTKLEYDIKKYKENLNENINISNSLRMSLESKNALLKDIVGEDIKCMFIIDKYGYIQNTDKDFNEIWTMYNNQNNYIELSKFLDDNIINKELFNKKIVKVKKYKIEIVFEVKSKDNRYFKCLLAPMSTNGLDGNIICSLLDITYKKTSQIKIKDNYMKYKKIVETIPYSILLTDEKDIIYNNNKDIGLDVNNSKIKNMILDNSSKGEICCSFNENQVFLNIDRVYFEDSKYKNLVVIKDITRYKKLLKKLEFSKEKYKLLVDLIPEGIYLCDYENKKILYENNTFLDMNNELNLNNYIKDNKNNIMIYSDDEFESMNFERKTILDKELNEVDIELGEMLIEINNTLNIIGIVRDISETLKLEEIEREIEAKKREDEIKAEFFINMSHELKTPLNVITSSMQLIEMLNNEDINKYPNSKISKNIKIIKKNSYILMNLINNIIDLAKLESKFHEYDINYYNIVDLIEDICYQFSQHIELKNIDIVFDTDEEEKISKVDANDIEKIILTLLCIVVRYSHKNSTIYVELNKKDDNTNISIRNKDNYDYYKYINDTDRRGLDIGIAVAIRIIELYKGKINIDINRHNGIKIDIELKNENEIYDYKDRKKINSETFLYPEYIKMCNL